jgi:hypothetical protein
MLKVAGPDRATDFSGGVSDCGAGGGGGGGDGSVIPSITTIVDCCAFASEENPRVTRARRA